ncbi:MAG: hypothetical protein KFF77_05920 [Bacteroidetes bacterium]|nr:hypothetical protein [Bacteroidota bacterium]
MRILNGDIKTAGLRIHLAEIDDVHGILRLKGKSTEKNNQGSNETFHGELSAGNETEVGTGL